MKDAQRPDHISLNTLIGRLKEGRFVIPDFQREFEWRPWDISKLMRSIFLDYYIGSLLLWKGKKENFKALSCEPVYGCNNGGSPEHIVLDGQQRLTALYYAFLMPDVTLPNRKMRALYFIRIDKLMAEEYDEAFDYDWLSRRRKKLLDNVQAQYKEHFFPLSVIGAGGWDLPNWIQGYEQFWDNIAEEAAAEDRQQEAKEAAVYGENARVFGKLVKGITEQYQVSYIELDQDLAIDKVCDIFTQINSRGIRLDVFDLINAMLKPKGLQLKQMWRKASSKFDFIETGKMNVYILQVMSIITQAYCSPKYLYYLLPGQIKQVRDPDGTRREEVLVSDEKVFETKWNNAIGALESTIKLLRHPQEYGAISSKYLPYVSILPVFAAMQHYLITLPPEQKLDAQRKIRHWYWASVFNNRYSGSVESTSARDFLDLKSWIADDQAEPSFILEFATSFRNLDLRKETKSGTSVYNGVFNLLILQGARDWMTGNVPQHDDLDDHHIVPASWGSEHLEGKRIHTILNRTPLISETNRNVINDKLPNEYLPEMIKKNGEQQVRAVLESHFISPEAINILLRDPFGSDDFEEFTAERQRTIKQAIESLLIKERLDLPPNLRNLDAEIEQVELGIRQVVQASLNSDPSVIPSHVLQRVDDRISKALKKNPSLDPEFYESLSGKLEFFDLRELQDTITGKSLWNKFDVRFVNKETLNAKFGQLAELRNGIRHSRTVDTVTQKEGEASILWFNQILKK